MSEQKLMEEARIVARVMRMYGGSFYEALGAALEYADAANTRKIHDAWKERWETFLSMGA